MLKIYPIGVNFPCPGIYKIIEKIHIKSEFKAVFLKLTANDQSSKGLICCLPLFRSCPGAIYMYKIYVKSEFKSVLLKLSADDQSDNSFLSDSKFTSLELSAPACIKAIKIHINQSSKPFFSETYSKLPE